MTIVDMLEQSGVLTLLGMGIVFSFLVILIVAVSLVGKLIHAIGADKDVNAPSAGTGYSPSSAVKTTAVAAAITAAVTEYQATHE
ncbi:OadG family protein [Leadbettera azotonutricia]|uniref:Sodium pump decarboxylase, gamma subunit n=1 Tax=Leadbettera azotonutricia (strain ATCC BAA-888 / DSM 13862 / ZAS-9) TaxID=545695 RepID=F5Y8U8_LEAAZ|nr:OadG family protein [Leadbettera azotonutricia]AEF81038.1 sodium pump decarboxylase, gamma subunit [Leadbettera azotonutricia ZAS-9]